jgi:RNA-splicing ligase RtcB
MLEVQGKYGKAKIFIDNVDESTMQQVYSILNSPISSKVHIRIMPDCHAGAGCVVGTTMEIKGKVCPNIVGVDIGCGVLVSELGKIEIDFESLDNFIKEEIPNGFSVYDSEKPGAHFVIKHLNCKDKLNKMDRLLASMGTLGGGNHFIEIDEDLEGNKYLLVHTGSRNLGYQVAQLYQNLATKRLEEKFELSKKTEIKEIVKKLKAEGREEEIGKTIKENTFKRDWPKDLDYLEGVDLLMYLEDMKLCQWFAQINRATISNKILSFLDVDIANTKRIDTVHNYIEVDADKEDPHRTILRKGAVSAKEGEELIMPINMKDGALLCIGKGNSDWNYSAPHGAGRILSRSKAKQELSVEDFKESMKGIYTSTANQKTLDEAPGAYKPIEDIINNIGDTVEIKKIIKPIYNFKAN